MKTLPMTDQAVDVPAWVAYLNDLETVLRAEIDQERWAIIFKGIDTPAQAAEKLAGHVG